MINGIHDVFSVRSPFFQSLEAVALDSEELPRVLFEIDLPRSVIPTLCRRRLSRWDSLHVHDLTILGCRIR
jgi:hypothetical protein